MVAGSILTVDPVSLFIKIVIRSGLGLDLYPYPLLISHQCYKFVRMLVRSNQDRNNLHRKN